MVVTRQHLKDMTGGKRPKEIIRWLRDNAPGRFRIGLDGWPRVHEKVAEEIFGVGAPSRGKVRPPPDVNLDHLKGGYGQAKEEQTRST